MNRLSVARAAALAACLVPLMALAHTAAVDHDHGTMASLGAGFSHPFTGLDHLAAMLALGVWSALTTRRVWVAPLAFAAALLAGALLGLAGVQVPAVEPMIATSLLVIGLLVATGQKLPPVVGAVGAAVFALFHGAAHGAELSDAGAVAAVVGMVIATMLLHAGGIGLGLMLRGRGRWLARAAGAAVAVFGVTLLAPMV